MLTCSFLLSDPFNLQPSHKSFKIKMHMGKLRKQNRPLPQWFRMKTGNTIRYAERVLIMLVERYAGGWEYMFISA